MFQSLIYLLTHSPSLILQTLIRCLVLVRQVMYWSSFGCVWAKHSPYHRKNIIKWKSKLCKNSNDNLCKIDGDNAIWVWKRKPQETLSQIAKTLQEKCTFSVSWGMSKIFTEKRSPWGGFQAKGWAVSEAQNLRGQVSLEHCDLGDEACGGGNMERCWGLGQRSCVPGA